MKLPSYRGAKSLPLVCARCRKRLWSDVESMEAPLIMHRGGSRAKAPEALYHPECAPARVDNRLDKR
jgi:hypothetical protein